MAGTEDKEIFDEPFQLEEEDDKEYAGGGFEADGLDIVREPDVDIDKEDADGDAEDTTDADEEAAKKAAADKAAESTPDVGKIVTDAVTKVSTSFNQQLMNLNTQFNEGLENLAKKMAVANKEKKPLPDKPTNEEWETDANAAHQKMAAYERAVEEQEAEESVDVDASDSGADISATELKTKQDESYGSAIKIIPEIDTDGSAERDIFTKIYFNPEMKLNEHPAGPVLAAVATNYYIQSQAGQADAADANADVDLANVDVDKDPDAAIKAGEKIIADARAKKHAMTRSSSRPESKGKVTLDKEHQKVARQLGVSDESYAEGMAVLNSGKGA